MRIPTIACLLLAGCIAACSKHSEQAKTDEPVNHSYIGTWKQIAAYQSPGGPGQWFPVTNGTTIRINSDSSYVSQQPADVFRTGNKFILLNDSTVQVGNSFPYQGNIRLSSNGDTLVIGFALCYEGCFSKFFRDRKHPL